MGPSDCPGIFILEDDTLVSMMIEEILDAMGCRCVGAFSDLFPAMAFAKHEACDAALTDLLIHGESAAPVIGLLEARGIPVGIASGAGHLDREDQWHRFPHVSKPFSESQIRGLVSELLPAWRPAA